MVVVGPGEDGAREVIGPTRVINGRLSILGSPDLVGAYQDSDGGGGRQCPPPLRSRFSQRATNSPKVSGLGFGAISGSVGQPLALGRLHGDGLALNVVVPKLGAGVLPEIEFGQIPVEVLLIHVLVDADKATLQIEKKPSSVLTWYSPRAHSNFEWSTLSCSGRMRVHVVLRFVGNERAVLVDILRRCRATPR